MADDLLPGTRFEVAYPFVLDEVTLFGPDGSHSQTTWRPGTRGELVAPDDAEDVADGVGQQILTVVSTHKPGKFPERVFFTRQWKSPDGNVFGKSNCRILVRQAFMRLTRGFRYEYRLVVKQESPTDD